MLTTTRPAALVCLTVAFLGIIGAYVALVLTGHGDNAGGLVSAVVMLLGAVGVSAHVETRTQQQNRTIAKIDRQTNGVLEGRIERGATRAVAKVLRSAGYPIPEVDEPAEPEPVDPHA